MIVILSAIGFFVLGLFSGLCTGLIGIGSTLLILPTLLLVFPHFLHHPLAVKMAIATTLASAGLIATRVSQMHIRKGTVCWGLFAAMTGIYICTAFIGASLVHYLPTHSVEGIVGVVLVLIAIKVLRRKNQIAEVKPKMPRWLFVIVIILAGLINSICGIATGTTAIPFLSRYYPYQNAIGTSVNSATVACLLAAVIYVFYGWHMPDRPHYTLGYVYLPVTVCIVVGSLVGSPIGNYLSNRLNVKWVKYVLATVIAIAGIVSIIKIV